jgi:hypothetical protein
MLRVDNMDVQSCGVDDGGRIDSSANINDPRQPPGVTPISRYAVYKTDGSLLVDEYQVSARNRHQAVAVG